MDNHILIPNQGFHDNDVIFHVRVNIGIVGNQKSYVCTWNLTYRDQTVN